MMRRFLSWMCLLGFIISGIAACAQARDTILDIQTVQSQSGVTAWLVEDHTLPIIALTFSFRDAGAKNDPADKQGLARMASNTMDEGAGPLDSHAFQEKLKNRSITLHFNSSRDHFGGTVKTLSKNKKEAFDLLRLALTEPRFDPEPVGRMRKANQSRIRAALADPAWVAARILNDTIYAGHPYAMNSGGSLTGLDAVKPDDLKRFVKALSRDRLVIAAAGDITAEELAAALDDVFGGLPARSERSSTPADTALQNAGKTFLYKKDIPQTIIRMAQPGIDHRDPAFHAAQVMNFILGSSGFGSRLTKEIREKRGLTYGIYSHLNTMEHVDTLTVSTSTKNEAVSEMLRLTKEEWSRMAAAPVTGAELNRARSYLTGSLPLSLTSTDKIANLVLFLQMNDLPVDYLDRRHDAIMSVTQDDVQAAAEKMLQPGAFTTVLVGQPDGLEKQDIITIDTLPGVE